MSPQKLNLIETSHISPPQGSVPTTALPLTFFDAPWLTLPIAKIVFFYSYSDSTAHFLSNTLPVLKYSLSLTLQHFYPYAGNLICPPRPDLPYLRYVDGQDSVLFTVLESTEHDFDHLKADYPKDVGILHDLAPKLPPAREISPDGVQKRPVMAIQVTVFPNTGICVAKTANHAVGDGVSAMHFIKYWMSMSKSMTLGGESPHDVSLPPPPIHPCREMIKDPGNIIAGHMERFWSLMSQNGESHAHAPHGKLVRSTFSMSRAQIENLKQWVKEGSENQKPISSFVVTLAFVWASLIKSLVGKDKTAEEGEKDESFHLLNNVDCRNRLKYEDPIPSTYFGNCMAPGIISMRKREILGENGIVVAANAIAGQIKGMLSSDILKTAPTWSGEVLKWVMSRFKFAVAGSPKLGMYNMDFGLGKPCKVEILHVETGDSFSVMESRDGHDGIEIGLALDADKMDLFTSNFNEGLKNCSH